MKGIKGTKDICQYAKLLVTRKKEENLNDFSTTRTTNIKNTDTPTCC